MKKLIFTLALIISISSAFAQPCSLTNLTVTVSPGTDGKCYANITFDMDRNNGNKFIYIHLWNLEQYAKVNKNRWLKGAGPNQNDIDGQGNGSNGHPSLATIAIDNNNYNAPVFSGYGYRPDPNVIARTGTSVTTTSTPVSGTGPHAYYRYTVNHVLLGNGTVSGGCTTANVCGIVWSTQANSVNSHIHCAYIGCNGNSSPFSLSGNANCATRLYTLTITNNSNSVTTANFDIYADTKGAPGGNPNGVFDPYQDSKFDSGYFSVNPNSTITITRSIPSQYLNFDLYAQVMRSNGCTQVVKLTTSSCGPLPVSLSTFTASRSRQTVLVKWQTSSEQSVKGFAIERLTDGGWEDQAYVASKSSNGNSSSVLNYEFTDANAFTSISQYRLRVIDIDGKYKYSDIRIVKGEFQKSSLTVYPNPGVNGKVNVLFEEVNTMRNVTVTDMSGRIVNELKSVSNNKVTIQNLRPGVYTLRVLNLSTQESQTEKILIID